MNVQDCIKTLLASDLSRGSKLNAFEVLLNSTFDHHSDLHGMQDNGLQFKRPLVTEYNERAKQLCFEQIAEMIQCCPPELSDEERRVFGIVVDMAIGSLDSERLCTRRLSFDVVYCYVMNGYMDMEDMLMNVSDKYGKMRGMLLKSMICERGQL